MCIAYMISHGFYSGMITDFTPSLYNTYKMLIKGVLRLK